MSEKLGLTGIAALEAEMRDRLAAKDAEITRLRAERPGWRTMESAPKDGRWLLAWSLDGQVYRVSWGRNHRGELTWCTVFGSFTVGHLTHWQSLESPPALHPSVAEGRGEKNSSMDAAASPFDHNKQE